MSAIDKQRYTVLGLLFKGDASGMDALNLARVMAGQKSIAYDEVMAAISAKKRGDVEAAREHLNTAKRCWMRSQGVEVFR